MHCQTAPLMGKNNSNFWQPLGNIPLSDNIKTATIAATDVLSHEFSCECNFLLKCLELPPYRWPHTQVTLVGNQISGGGGDDGGGCCGSG